VSATVPKIPRDRGPRPPRDVSARFSPTQFLTELCAWPDLRKIAEALPTWHPGDEGRPPLHPPIAHLIFGLYAAMHGGLRSADTMFNDLNHWETVRNSLVEDYAHYPGIAEPGRPLNRWSFQRYANKLSTDRCLLDLLRQEFELHAARQAAAQGICATSSGKTRLHPDSVAFGDGTVVAGIYKTSADDLCELRGPDGERTGEFRVRRHDDEVCWYESGDRKRTLGHKMVFLEGANGYERESVVLASELLPRTISGREADLAVEMVLRAKDRLPHMEGVAWDKAIRGTHVQTLLSADVQPVAKVSEAGAKPREVHLERLPARRHNTVVGGVDVFALGGAAAIKTIVRGSHVPVILEKVKIEVRPNADGSYRTYGQYRIPEDPRVPSELRGAGIRLRHYTTTRTAGAASTGPRCSGPSPRRTPTGLRPTATGRRPSRSTAGSSTSCPRDDPRPRERRGSTSGCSCSVSPGTSSRTSSTASERHSSPPDPHWVLPHPRHERPSPARPHHADGTMRDGRTGATATSA
jgi:hypothetical protein